MTDQPQVTYLTDAEAAEWTRRRETLSLECAANPPRCAGCDSDAAEGRGRCLHDCHSCPSRIAHEDGGVRRCQLDPHPADVLHEAGDVRWSDDNEQVIGGQPDDLDRLLASSAASSARGSPPSRTETAVPDLDTELHRLAALPDDALAAVLRDVAARTDPPPQALIDSVRQLDPAREDPDATR